MSARERDPERVYTTAAIEVHWEPRLCIHTGNCVHGLPQVFNPTARPWVDVDAADADGIANTIDTCPTGALHYRRLDGDAPRQAPVYVTVEPHPHGPLFVRGPVRVVDADGHVIREGSRLALCRCGASENTPFCDGSHRRIGFQSEAGRQ
jgi:uncharacterized Fe-S cluster protein YjdI/CDGSH-type Zn-finger protein